MSKHVLNLDQVSMVDVKLVGGKAASLGEMIQAGINVSPGFVVTTAAKGKMLDDLKEQILAAFDELGQEFVAVRSSAVAEDGTEASWAGQLETYLNVTRDNLIESIEKCWNSINSERAKAYAEEKGVKATGADVGVVVQAMIQSDVAGVAFSANPVTSNRDEVIIEAVFGIGEALVSGQITPDNYIVSKSGEIKSKYVSQQNKKLSKSSNGVDWEEIGADGEQQKLSDEQVLELLEQVKRVEDHYGFPVDIEWVTLGDKLFIMQSRPITTLSQTDAQTHEPLYEPGVKIFRWGPIPGRWYYMSDFTCALLSDFAEKLIIKPFPKAQNLFVDGQIIWLINQAEFEHYTLDLFEDLLRRQKEAEQLKKDYQAVVDNLLEFEKQDFSDLSLVQIKETASELFSILQDFWLPTLIFEFAGYGAETWLNRELADAIPAAKERYKAIIKLTMPQEDSFFLKADRELIATDDLGTYARKYYWLNSGYDGIKNLKAEDFAAIKARINKSLLENVEQSRAQSRQSRQKLIEKYQISPEILAAADQAADILIFQDERKAMMMQLQHMKERLIERFAKVLDLELDWLRNIGLNELAEKSEAELKKLANHRADAKIGVTQSQDKAKTLKFFKHELVEHYWDHYSSSKVEGINNMVRGLVASRGSMARYRGEVVVVDKPIEAARFPEGAILVTQMTSPDYIHLMKKSSGIITDGGGLTSHAAIISRELAVPCIVNTSRATAVLKTGDQVEMDVHGGTVRVLDSK